jgi:hypothetical protein
MMLEIKKSFVDCRSSPAVCLFSLYLAGSLFLPIASFANLANLANLGDQGDAFVQVLGNALPYGPWFNRATLLGPIVLIIAFWIAWRNRRWPAFHWMDTWVGIWIVLPALVGVFNDSPYSDDGIQCIYLALVWGAPYAASRIVCYRSLDSYRILQVICWFGIATFALALLEFFFGRFFYSMLYGFHPFYLQGVSRFIGYRPMLFFEDPNQIAMWWMTVAVSSIAVLNQQPKRTPPNWLLWILSTTPYLFQAFGAGILTLLGACALKVRRLPFIRNVVIATLVFTIVVFVLRGPLLKLGREFIDSNPAGKSIRSVLREGSIGSLGWRIALEDDVYSVIKKRPYCGWGSVNFWQTEDPLQKRPWGLATLVTGAYGVIGVGVWGMMLWIPSVWIVIRRNHGASSAMPIDSLAILVGLHAIDALLNSAFFLPVVFFLGFLVSSIASKSQDRSPLATC